MVCQNRSRLWSMKCVLIFVCAPLKIHCHLEMVYGVCVIPWKQAETVHGFQHWKGRCWQRVTWAPGMFTTDDAWRTDAHSCGRCQKATHSLGSAQNCTWPTGLHRSVCTLGAKECHRWWQSSFYGTMGLSCINWTCYTDHIEQFWSWKMVNYTKPEIRKRTCDRESINSLQQRKWKHWHQ